jgi:hypothetical protein
MRWSDNDDRKAKGKFEDKKTFTKSPSLMQMEETEMTKAEVGKKEPKTKKSVKRMDGKGTVNLTLQKDCEKIKNALFMLGTKNRRSLFHGSTNAVGFSFETNDFSTEVCWRSLCYC